ncbi:proline-rich receptor-like protein kinase PERK8 [Pyrus ussuriensis x Pyrus communis]|uniref:Proline-rich receptor-like protein kinase PERK8 n=1 Tax=Pyrus ussuriensis x Pyrus communis TaxID=2448454 RepID=A0A5N5FZF8_9ROSA|nr:proline-rich receptor-like protein kinase PERK8 [Pyrus ussuriensis x Pyrus communis]
MKGIDIFCASPASTAICSSLDAVVRRGPRPLDHGHYHRLHDHDQRKNQPHHQTHHFTKYLRTKSSAEIHDLTRAKSANGSSSSPSRFLLSDSPFIDRISEPDCKNVSAAAFVPPQVPSKPRDSMSSNVPLQVPSKVPSKPRDSMSSNVPPQVPSKPRVSTSSNVPPQVPSKPRGSMSSNGHCSTVLKSSSASSGHQVVVLRVSLHCKGCEGKVRKHLSKMEGVTSFSIDFQTKRVTVVGDVTPLGVLSSVSKVRKSQFWPSPTSSSPSSRLPA